MESNLKFSSSIKNVAAKILQVQNELPSVTKDAKNPFFKSKYSSLNQYLEVLVPMFNKANLVVTQLVDGNFLSTMVICPDSGEFIVSSYPINPTITEISKTDGKIITRSMTPQEMGSQISYAKRYSLSSIFLVISDDDDANLATNGATSFTTPAKITGTELSNNTFTKTPEQEDKTKWVNSKADPNYALAKKLISEGKVTKKEELWSTFGFNTLPKNDPLGIIKNIKKELEDLLK